MPLDGQLTERNDREYREPGDKDERIVRLKERFDSLKGSTERANCEAHWQDIAEVIAPRKLDFVGDRTPGEKRMNKVYDPTGIQALEMLAAGLHGMATNPASKWFSLRMIGQRVPGPDGEPIDINEIPEVQEYMAHVEEVMWQRIYAPGTQFTTSMHECYLDIGAFGTCVLFIGESEDGGLLFQAKPLAEVVIAENADGKIDTVFRKFRFTVRQVWQMQNQLGWKPSDETRKKYEDKKYDEPVEIIHAVYPRADREPGKANPENMPFASCYFELKEAHELKSSGFPEFPYQVARWSKYSDEVYGRGPGMIALPEVKMLQAMTLAKIKLIHKAADPPMWLSDDGVIGQTRTIPGGLNYIRGNPNERVMLQPVSLQGIQFLAEDIREQRESVLRLFYADLMRMTDRANMTATEVVQRTQEMMRLFGPLIGRLESEMLGPLVERVFGILTRQGLLPDPPEVLQGKDFTVEYVSPIATAQKQAHFQGIVQVMQMIMLFGEEAAAAIVQKNVDVDKMFKKLWDGFNNDPDMLRDDEEVEQANQLGMAQQAAGLAGQVMGPVQQGAAAIKDVASANQASGPAEGGPAFDINQLLARFGGEVQDNSQAQAELMAMAEQVPGMGGGA